MLRCFECGEDNDADAVRCTACGRPLNATEEETPTGLAPAPPATAATAIGRHVSTLAPKEDGTAPTRVRPAEVEPTQVRPADEEAGSNPRTGTRVPTEARTVPSTEDSRGTGPHDATHVSRAASCAACNRAVRPGWRFCKSCGSPLSDTGALPRWRHSLIERSRPTGPARRTLELEGAVTVLGRKLADIVLDDAAVSGSHAAVEIDGDACHVRDLESTNGTFVAVRGFETLWPGAVILLGPHRLLYRRREGGSADERELVLVATGGREKASFVVGDEPVVLGTSRADIALPSAPGLAGRHAEIAWTGSTHAVRGLSAPNPTWLLVKRRRALTDHDRLRVGDTTYEYRRSRG